MAIKSSENRIQIIGAGLSGLTTAMTLAKNGILCNLISLQPSERSQSVMAEGGINGAVNSMGEDDKPTEHFADTIKAGVYLGNAEAIRGLTENAPKIIKMLDNLGVPFHKENGVLQQRNFGGQKKKRTAYSQSSTGKCIMTSLINEVRKYENCGLIKRYDHHEFLSLHLNNKNECCGAYVAEYYTRKVELFCGKVVLAVGGMNGLFPNMTTGTTTNTSNAVAEVFSQGVRLSNLEMIQYHPTTIQIAGKRCLVSEASRGEGARLFVEKNGKDYYFMEDKYPELANLMPRDVIAREMYFQQNDKETNSQIYLDMRGIPKEVLQKKLGDLCDELKHYLGINAKKSPIPISQGIHYFMGGISVDVNHRTNIKNLYAVGECCSQYHGANRLGGNSLLGAVHSGIVSAEDIISSSISEIPVANLQSESELPLENISPKMAHKIGSILTNALGIVREEKELKQAILEICELKKSSSINKPTKNRLNLASAILQSAMFRKESRGAHFRSDYPTLNENLATMTIAEFSEEVSIRYDNIKQKNLTLDRS